MENVALKTRQCKTFTMRRMAEIALDINNAPRDPLAPTAAYGVVLHSSS
jgi:hypothetical protein